MDVAQGLPLAEILQLMKWPLLACLLLPPILVYYGLHIVRREIIFVDLALAQFAALGNCLAILLGHDSHDWQNYAWSLGFTIAGAAIFTFTRTADRRVPQEALIGIVYVVAAAAGILMLSRSAEGNEELQRTMVGEVLVVHSSEVWKTFGLFLVVGLIHWIFRRQFLMISFEPERARALGMSIRGWDFIFYVLFGFVVTSFVHIGGVLLVFSYLIVPAVGANFLVKSLRGRILLGCLISSLGSIAGLMASYQFDFPTGAAIVCTLGAVLLIIICLAGFFDKSRG